MKKKDGSKYIGHEILADINKYKSSGVNNISFKILPDKSQDKKKFLCLNKAIKTAQLGKDTKVTYYEDQSFKQVEKSNCKGLDSSFIDKIPLSRQGFELILEIEDKKIMAKLMHSFLNKCKESEKCFF